VIGLTCFCAKSFLLRGMLSRNRVVREGILALFQCYFFFLRIKKFIASRRSSQCEKKKIINNSNYLKAFNSLFLKNKNLVLEFNITTVLECNIKTFLPSSLNI
jgi:hypothetical protein